MNIFYAALGIFLTMIFFFNIRAFSEAICRLTAGFAVLILYGPISAFLSLPHVGINLLNSAVIGILGLPGILLSASVSYFFMK